MKINEFFNNMSSKKQIRRPIHAIKVTPPPVMLTDEEINHVNAPEDHQIAFHRRHNTQEWQRMRNWD